MENNRLEMAEPAARASIEALLVTIHQQIDVVRRQIQDHMDDHPDLKSQKALLLSIPGIGEATAAMLPAFLSPLTRFHSAKQVVAYAGLNPRIRESGQWASKGRRYNDPVFTNWNSQYSVKFFTTARSLVRCK
ncbi:IS110 family transposase [Acidithiobacillus sp. HP-6]|nr:IS110 family transposase [Acidithiobacillus sp. HP-6]MBE7569767.1 IS110 family transposase [Acidithiobacillus sp. HP-2]